MTSLLRYAFAILLYATTAAAQSGSGCPNGTYSVVNAPDGGTLSILFDSFIAEAGGGSGLVADTKSCSLQIPLNLPAGYSLGLYRVDYRGFAQLSDKQTSELSVNYALGPRNNSRAYRRSVRGPYTQDFFFTENLGAGLMKRVGCGDAAVLNVAIALRVQTNGRPGSAIASLDSSDGTVRGGLIYHFDLKKCRERVPTDL